MIRRLRRKGALISLCFLVGAIALSLCFAGAGRASAESVKDTNVVYEQVDKSIVVSDKKVCRIVETITVVYKRPDINLGLRRNVSRKNKVTRLIGGKKVVRTTLSKFHLLSVTMDGAEEYNFVEHDNDYYYINTGADGDYKEGRHVYRIEYDYDLGEDYISDFDDFTFDLMDYGFRGKVDLFTASVTLPKEFDLADLTFRTNDMEPVDHSEANLTTEGNTFSCAYREIPAGHGLTVQLILPAGYFDTRRVTEPAYIAAIIVTVLSAVASALLFTSLALRNKRKTVQTVEFYPPTGYSPMDVAKTFRGKVRPKDFTALVIYWESKGYLKIKFNGKKDLTLVKLRDMPAKEEGVENDKTGHTAYVKERAYFNAIFKRRDVFHTKTAKSAATMDIREKATKLYEVSPYKPFSKKHNVLFKLALHVLSFLPFVALIVSGMIREQNAYLLFILLFTAVAVAIFCYTDVWIAFKTVFCLMFGGLPTAALFVFCYMPVYDPLLLIIPAAVIFFVGNFVLTRLVRFRTDENLKLWGPMAGFKNFLLHAEVSRIEALVEENPNYYYDVLPYCYVFGITKKMRSRFDGLRLTLPAMEGIPFEVGTYSLSSLTGSMSSMTRGIRSSSSGGGGFSGGGGGGGSSGGGGGGGGCGGR